MLVLRARTSSTTRLSRRRFSCLLASSMRLITKHSDVHSSTVPALSFTKLRQLFAATARVYVHARPSLVGFRGTWVVAALCPSAVLLLIGHPPRSVLRRSTACMCSAQHRIAHCCLHTRSLLCVCVCVLFCLGFGPLLYLFLPFALSTPRLCGFARISSGASCATSDFF